MDDELRSSEGIRRRLEALGADPASRWHDQRDLAGNELSESAVLIPLCERDGQFYIVFTKRSQGLRNHSGEISFPGGRRELGDDSPADTALRETDEEVALTPSDVRLYGALTHIPTITGFEVTAYVGEFDPQNELIRNPDEIDLIFQAPIGELADPAIHHVEQRNFDGHVYPVHFFDWKDHVIWGATGFLLDAFLDYIG